MHQDSWPQWGGHRCTWASQAAGCNTASITAGLVTASQDTVLFFIRTMPTRIEGDANQCNESIKSSHCYSHTSWAMISKCLLWNSIVLLTLSSIQISYKFIMDQNKHLYLLPDLYCHSFPCLFWTVGGLNRGNPACFVSPTNTPTPPPDITHI